MNLDSFLRSLSDVDRDSNLRIVIGNEAADLDSMASSVAYSYLLSQTEGARNILPVINIPHSDFSLRTEAVWLFAEVGIDTSNLVFTDEIDLDALQSAGRLELVLIDHNKLPAAYTNWSAPVVEILDHHADEGLYQDAARTVVAVGSCATLVAERFLESAPQLLDAAVSKLLLGTILLDTVNLDPEAKRATDRDANAVNKLLKNIDVSRGEMFDKLQFEKFNVSALSTRDILRKDYKEYVMGDIRCGISSALLPLRDWTKKDPHLSDSFRSFAEEKRLDLLLAMSAFTAPEFRRELAVYSSHSTHRTRVVDALNNAGMGLAALSFDWPEATEEVELYSQANAAGSRKKVQPVLAAEFGGSA